MSVLYAAAWVSATEANDADVSVHLTRAGALEWLRAKIPSGDWADSAYPALAPENRAGLDAADPRVGDAERVVGIFWPTYRCTPPEWDRERWRFTRYEHVLVREIAVDAA